MPNRSKLCAAFAVALTVAAPRPARANGSETESIARVLELREGMTVADVGAGDGEWAERLAQVVGPAGRVIATEVDPAEQTKIDARVRSAGLSNVTSVLGTQHDTGLGEACCDAILLRMVYHHFAEPASMRADLRRALKPGARLAIIDIDPQKGWRELKDAPDRGGHGIRTAELVRELTSDGFEVVARYEDWNGDDDRYCVVFRVARP